MLWIVRNQSERLAFDADLIAQLSESFERLDNEQKELAWVEAAVAGVAGFLEVYRDFGRGIARSVLANRPKRRS